MLSEARKKRPASRESLRHKKSTSVTGAERFIIAGAARIAW